MALTKLYVCLRFVLRSTIAHLPPATLQLLTAEQRHAREVFPSLHNLLLQTSAVYQKAFESSLIARLNSLRKDETNSSDDDDAAADFASEPEAS